MRVTIRTTFRLMLIMAALLATQAVAHAQQPTAAQRKYVGEFAFDYTYLHSNAPPGGCGCFNMNGGSVSFAWPLGSGKLSLVGDGTLLQNGSISKDNLNLTMGAYTAGVRFRPFARTSAFRPFGQVLVGVAHAGGSLVHSQLNTVSNSGAAFASNVGGGVDLRVNNRFSLRLAEADYLITTFKNGDNDHQNNFRLSAGVVIRF
ncbi:MAG TPA: outer membrane beta-barrel protein [Acidobacteriaceae bacterium]|nr:outer membrane beta-barrel protein [Acidobacteriaceae bacterium]